MITKEFSQPIQFTDFDCSQFKLDYKLHKQWESKTTTSFSNKNKILKGEEYLINKLFEYTTKLTDKKHNIKLIEIWRNEYDKGDYQETHIHPFSHFSFSIFYKIPKNSGQFKLYNPSVDFVYKYEKIENPYFFQMIWPNQKENTIMIWPSYLKHMVTAGTNKTKRITYSGNFDIIL